MDNEVQVVWEATVDQAQFSCKVVRTDERNGVLTVVRNSDNKELLRESVGLSYGAIFGPDVDDVAYWQDKSIQAIDSQQ